MPKPVTTGVFTRPKVFWRINLVSRRNEERSLPVALNHKLSIRTTNSHSLLLKLKPIPVFSNRYDVRSSLQTIFRTIQDAAPMCLLCVFILRVACKLLAALPNWPFAGILKVVLVLRGIIGMFIGPPIVIAHTN